LPEKSLFGAVMSEIANIPPKELAAELAAYKGQTVVIKIGGNSIDEDERFLPSLANQLAFLENHGMHVVLVHGGGPQIDRALKAANLTYTKGPDGRRNTTPAMMDIVADTMNKISLQVADALRHLNSDVFTASAEKTCFIEARPLTQNGDERTGMPAKVDVEGLRKPLEEGKIVVLNSVGCGPKERLFNINADDCATAIAMELKAKRLVMATNVAGVMDKNKNIISHLTPNEAHKLFKDGTIAGGMIPKVESALKALNSGVGGVAIINAHKKDFLLKELLTRKGLGTLISRE